MSPSGSDANPCSQTAPCASFDRAYHAAAPGRTVVIGSGSYPQQVITYDASKSNASSRVVFQPAGPVTVMPALSIQGSHIDIGGITSGNWNVAPSSFAVGVPQPVDVVVRNMTVSTFGIFGAANVQVLGGSVGPAVDNSSNVALGAVAPSNILISGVSFHDYTRTSAAVHMECLHVWPATQLVLRGNRFRNCAVMDVLLSNYGPVADLSGITIENNVFDAPGSVAGGLSQGFYSVFFAPFGRTASNVSVAYNSMLSPLVFDPNGSYSNVRVDSNVGSRTQFACAYGGPGISYSYNVWDQAHCGPNDVQAPMGFIDPANLNLGLAPGSAGINHGNPANYPPTDVNGVGRPLGGAPDAGAYEG